MTTTTDTTERAAHLPPPLAKPWTFRWGGQKIENLLWALIGGHIIRWNWIFTYFILTQNNLVRPHWNGLLDGLLGASLWTVIRHFARAGMESQLTSATLWVILANPFNLLKPHKDVHGLKKILREIFAPSWLLSTLERLGIPTPRKYQQTERLKWWQWLFMLPALLVSAIPGYAMGIGIFFLVSFIGQHFGVHVHYDYSHYPAFVRQDLDAFVGSWQYTLAGVLGTVFYSRLVFKVYSIEMMRILAVQMAAVHQRAEAAGRMVLSRLTAATWPLPVGFRAEYRIANRQPAKYRKSVKWVMAVVAAYTVIGSVAGYVIISFVATGQMRIPYFS